MGEKLKTSRSFLWAKRDNRIQYHLVGNSAEGIRLPVDPVAAEQAATAIWADFISDGSSLAKERPSRFKSVLAAGAVAVAAARNLVESI